MLTTLAFIKIKSMQFLGLLGCNETVFALEDWQQNMPVIKITIIQHHDLSHPTTGCGVNKSRVGSVGSNLRDFCHGRLIKVVTADNS